ncbi:MAG: calcium-binding protein [Gemmobacter sp.]
MAGPGGTISLSDDDDRFPGIDDDNSGAEWINALNGSDTVLGGLLNDTIFGGSGDDELFGNGGDDFLDGSDSNDRLEGGDGNDQIRDFGGQFTFTDGGDGDDNVSLGTGFQQGSVVNGGLGYDTLSLGDTFSLNLLKVSNFEEMATLSGVVTGTAKQFSGFDRIYNSSETPDASVSLNLFGLAGIDYKVNLGAALANVAVLFVGSLGNDRIITGRGNDTVFGDLGNDILFGSQGHDDLHGSAGNDTLVGGIGRDTLTGGGDDDTYVYQKAKDSQGQGDLIIGWGNGDDIIDLRPIDAIPGGANDAFDFIGGAAISGSGGEVQAVTTAMQTVVNVYIDTDAVADMRIVIDGVFTLTAGDFLL